MKDLAKEMVLWSSSKQYQDPKDPDLTESVPYRPRHSQPDKGKPTTLEDLGPQPTMADDDVYHQVHPQTKDEDPGKSTLKFSATRAPMANDPLHSSQTLNTRVDGTEEVDRSSVLSVHRSRSLTDLSSLRRERPQHVRAISDMCSSVWLQDKSPGRFLWQPATDKTFDRRIDVLFEIFKHQLPIRDKIWRDRCRGLFNNAERQARLLKRAMKDAVAAAAVVADNEPKGLLPSGEYFWDDAHLKLLAEVEENERSIETACVTHSRCAFEIERCISDLEVEMDLPSGQF